MIGQILISGLSYGAIYALIALAMTVLYRSTQVVNFGHGDLVMIGAFLAYVFVLILGIPYLIAAPLAIIILFIFGVFIDKKLIGPLQYGPHISIAMMTVAIGYLLRGVARALWGREVLAMPPIIEFSPIFLGNVVITSDAVLNISTVLFLVIVFFFILFRTNFGKLVQAIYQNERGAKLIGINVNKFRSIMWGIAISMGAVGGILISPVTLLHPDLGANLLIHSFAAMTLGGFGSLHGAIIGGFILGISEQLLGVYVSTALIDIAAYIIIIMVLLIRPVGLFGEKVTTKV